MIKHLAVLKSPIAAPTDAPEWWRFLPAGEIYILGDPEPKIMDDEAASMVLKYFKHLGRDIVIDYEHQTQSGGKAPAAAWIKEFDWRGPDGLWVRTEWTRTAAKHIAEKEYRYYSPVMYFRQSDGRIVAIINAALTNEPKTRNLAAIAAKMDLNVLTHQPKEPDMWKKLIKLLNLKDDADQAAVESAVESVVAKNTELEARIAKIDNAKVVACKGVLDALGLDATAEENVVVAKIQGLTATDTAATKLAAEVAVLSGKIGDMQVEKLTSKALKNGQTSPKELEDWGNDLARKDPEKFELIVCSRPVGSVIPVTRTKTVDDLKPGETPDDVQLSINKMLGLDEKTWKEFGPQQQD